MCPLGTGYNYFLACDTAERIIFTVVAGSSSGKLCWHSRGTDNNQENAGCVRESAGGSEQALRAEEVQKRSFCRRSFPHFFRCWKKWGRRRQRKRSRRGAKLSPVETNTTLTPLRGYTSSAPFGGTCLPAGRSTDLTGHRRVIQHRGPIKGKAWRLRAGVQRKFTVFLQNLKVELRKASML